MEKVKNKNVHLMMPEGVCVLTGWTEKKSTCQENMAAVAATETNMQKLLIKEVMMIKTCSWLFNIFFCYDLIKLTV